MRREELRQRQQRVREFYENMGRGLTFVAREFDISPSTAARDIKAAGGRLRSQREGIALHKEWLFGRGARHLDLLNPVRLAYLLGTHGSVAALARNIKASQRTVAMAARRHGLLGAPSRRKHFPYRRPTRAQLLFPLLLVASGWALLEVLTRRRLRRLLSLTRRPRAVPTRKPEKTHEEARAAVVAWLERRSSELVSLFVDVVELANPVGKSTVRVRCACGAEHERRLDRFAHGEAPVGLKAQRRCPTCARKRELSEPRRQVLAWLEAHPRGGTPKQIAQDLGMSPGSVRQLLSRMKQQEYVTASDRGWYTIRDQ